MAAVGVVLGGAGASQPPAEVVEELGQPVDEFGECADDGVGVGAVDRPAGFLSEFGELAQVS